MALDSGAPGSIKTGERIGHPKQFLEAVELKRGQRHDRAVALTEDFLADAGATLPTPWGTVDVSSAGTPTLAYVADSASGTFVLTHDGTSELQSMTLAWADQLMIDATAGPGFECRVTVTEASPSADQRIVFGLAAARNATLDSNATHAWFRLEGANQNILVEADDGTTDTNDQDTGVDWVSGTALVLRIDARDLTAITYYVDGVAVATTSAPLLTGNLQPYIEIQKDAGTETSSVSVDYVSVWWDR